MKKIIAAILAAVMILSMAACEAAPNPIENSENSESAIEEENVEINDREAISAKYSEATLIDFDGEITAEGVTVGGEIVYYKNMDNYESKNPYGEGKEEDKHTEEEAKEHTLVTITEPGEYLLMGSLKGQLAVDLGEEAKTDPGAKVTLIFGGAEINCEIAPAVIFYNVYECSDIESEEPETNTTETGANVVIADYSENSVNGSYVAKILEDSTEAKELHKYDGAFYSKMSMTVSGGEKSTGVLNIKGENEGMGSELHLFIEGGNLNIESQDDAVNANAGGYSVVAINGGNVTVKGGMGSEGDGIDSNGCILITGGTLEAHGNGRTGDGGIDADNGIYISGGYVAAFGSRNDPIIPVGDYVSAEFTFSSVRGMKSTVKFVDENGNGISAESEREFQSLVLAGENLEKDKVYNLYVNDIMQEYSENRNSMSDMDKVPAMFEIIGGISEAFIGAFQEYRDNHKEEGRDPFENVPEGLEEWVDSTEGIPADIKAWLESITGEELPRNESEEPKLAEENPDKTQFTITDRIWNFSGIFDSPKATGKEQVTFGINGRNRFDDIYKGDSPEIYSIRCEKDIPASQIQITLESIGGNETNSVSKICLLSEGYEAVNALFEGLSVGTYHITVAVVAENEHYSGSSSFNFKVVD